MISQEVDSRSLFAKPFPLEAQIDALSTFFTTHAPVNCVRMRRVLGSKVFRGSIFVEFATVEEADKVRGAGMQAAERKGLGF